MTSFDSRPTASSYARGGMVAAALLLVVLLLPVATYGQGGTSTLTGTVYDPTGAVVPGAQVVLRNDATGVGRETVSNGVGYFSFPSILPGSYTVIVTAKGFKAWEQKGITISQAQTRTLPNIELQVGGPTETVTVVTGVEEMAPVSTGATATTLSENMIGNLAIQGRNAAELIKVLPGMAMVGGATMLSQDQFNSINTQTNSGVVGRYSANGTQPYGGMQVTIDGGIIVDTGNMGTQTANINQDQISELTVRNSAFDAEYAHGPVTVDAISKGGGSSFHGSGYVYTRGGTFNAFASELKGQGVTNKPNDHYWYPGFTVGGPVLIPGSDFNRKRDKLFFLVGFEYMMQHPVGQLYNYLVPTEAMRNGDFSTAALAPFQGHGWATATPPCDPSQSGQWWWGNFCSTAGITNGNVSSFIDPNGLAYMRTFPAPTVDPLTHNGFNYQFIDQSPINRWEFKGRADYNLSPKTRFYLSYTRQHETDIGSIGVWWWPGGSLP